MTYSGTVINGQIVLEHDQRLPEGSQVQVQLVTPPPAASSLGERLLKLAGTVDDLPADMARNHDHYLHG